MKSATKRERHGCGRDDMVEPCFVSYLCIVKTTMIRQTTDRTFLLSHSAVSKVDTQSCGQLYNLHRAF